MLVLLIFICLFLGKSASSITKPAGDSVTLQCIDNADLRIVYQEHNITDNSTSISWSKNTLHMTDVDDVVNLTLSMLDISATGEYQCNIEDTNGTSYWSNTFLLEVSELPAPAEPKLVPHSATSINVSYLDAVHHLLSYNTTVTGYRVNISCVDAYDDSCEPQTHVADRDDGMILVTDLSPYTQYRGSVQVVYDWGESQWGPWSAPNRTLSAAPSQEPLILSVNSTSRTITLLLELPPNHTHHGIIEGYNICYKEPQNTDKRNSFKHNPQPTMEVVLSQGIKPYTKYEISVVLENDAGASPAANTTIQTAEDLPGQPTITNSVATSRNATITWTPPVERNGVIINYWIQWKDKTKPNEVYRERIDRVHNTQDLYSHPITGLEPARQYKVYLSAATSAGSGPNHTTDVHTEVEGPGPPQNVTIAYNSSSSIIVSWLKPAKYYTTVHGYCVRYNDTLEIRTDCIDAVPDTNKQEYVISSLVPGNTYYIEVAGLTPSIKHQDKNFTGNFSEPEKYKLEDYDLRSRAESRNAIIAGLIAGLTVTLLLIIIGVIVLCVLRRVLNKRYASIPPSDQNAPTNSVMLPEAYTAPRPAKSPDDQDCVTVNDFVSHVASLHCDGDLGFSQQYDEINRSCNIDLTSNHSHDAENRNKNRYINIIAYDHSRVILRPLPGKNKQSDYVNANYVDGYHKPQAYIATQGPLPATFNDFWRMIWEQNSNVICMITNLVERGRRKCDQYWPSEGEHAYGAITVRLLSTNQMAHYTIRVFTIRHTKLKKSDSRWPSFKSHRNIQRSSYVGERIVKQYHYTFWPDHGVPDYALPVLHYVRKSVSAAGDDGGPIIIHCSAGVGRTGTYIVLDSMMKQIQDKSTVNVKGFLTYIRNYRNYLVQTEDQYIFIHDALLEFIQSGGDTEIRSGDFNQHVLTLESEMEKEGEEEEEEEQLMPPEGRGCKLAEEYQLVTSFRPKEDDMIAALLPVNEAKNRSSEVLPLDMSRVCLPMLPGEEGSDYINASYLQGYNRNEEYIITQHPLESTISDLWRMIWDKNCMTVVLLSDITEDTVCFWPSEEEMDCGNFKVTFQEETLQELEKHSTRDFLLQSTQDDYECTTRLICAPGWPHDCENMVEPFELVKAVRTWHEANQVEEGPIVVIDKLGSTDAGLLCALSTLYDQLHNEAAIDVYTTAKLYHLKRPAIFLSQNTYLYLYKVMASLCDDSTDHDSGISNCKSLPETSTSKPSNGSLNNGTVKHETTVL